MLGASAERASSHGTRATPRTRHHRYASCRSGRRLWLCARANAEPRRSGARRRPIRPRVRGRANDPAVARVAYDRPISAGTRRTRQRDARLGGRADAGEDAVGGGCDRRVCRRVSARPSVRPEPGSTSTATGFHGPAAGRRASGPAGKRSTRPSRGWQIGPLVIQAPLPLGPPLRTARAVRRPEIAGRLPTGMTTRWRRAIARSGGWSRRSGPEAAATVVVVAGDHGEAFGEHGELRTASSSTTRRCGCRSSSPVPASRAGARSMARSRSLTSRRRRCGCSG